MLPLIALVIGGSLASAFALGSTGGSVASLIGVGLFGIVVVLVAMAVGMALSLALWFAPALVVFDEAPALDALKLSLRAGVGQRGRVHGVRPRAARRRPSWRSPRHWPPSSSSPLAANRPAPSPSSSSAAPSSSRSCASVLLLPAAWGAMYASYEDVFGGGARTRIRNPARRAVRTSGRLGKALP